MKCRDLKRKSRAVTKLNCISCGNEFIAFKITIKKGRKYCSKLCSSKVNLEKRVKTPKERGINISKALKGKTPKNIKYLIEKGAKFRFKKGQFSQEKHPMWKGGITPLNQKIRHSDEYVKWRVSIFEKDNYTCQWCGQRGGKLNADHIFPFALHKKKRLSILNGRTLCKNCHKKRTATQMTVLWKNQTAKNNFF